MNSTDADPVAAIQALTGGNGADVVIDAVGRPETWKQAFYARDLAGTVVLVGVPTPGHEDPRHPADRRLRPRRRAEVAAGTATACPRRDFPMLVDLYQQGRLDLDAFVSEEIGLGDVEAAFEKMHHGDVLRSRGDLLMSRSASTTRVTSGTFSLDGETFDVDNNIWVVGDDDECVVIDAPHDVDGDPGRRRRPHGSSAIVCTHAHDDHVRVAPALREAVGAPILLHPDDRPLWELTHPDLPLGRRPRRRPGDRRSAGTTLTVLHTPGPRARRGLPARARPRLRLHRRHAVPGRPGRDRAVVQRRRPDRGVDPGAAVRAARRDASSTPATATTPRSAPSGPGWADRRARGDLSQSVLPSRSCGVRRPAPSSR